MILGIRPSDMEDTAVWQTESLPVIEVAAEVIEELGSEVNVLFSVDAPPVATEDTLAAAAVEGDEEELIPLIGEDDHTLFCARVDARTKARPGARVRLSFDPERFHYFDKDTGMRLGQEGAHSTVPADLALQSPDSTP